MKKIKQLFVAFPIIVMACEKVLDKQPQDRISEAKLWSDEKLADAYLTDVYSNVIFRRLGSENVGFGLISGMADEMTQFAPWQEPNKAIATPMNSETLYPPLNYWKYDVIRKINIFIEKVKSSGFNEVYKKGRIAEARWIRAYCYFEMVKRWGGIPLITKVQNPDDDPQTIFVPRNKEQEVYDFINAEMESIFDNLPGSYDNEKGRATKWAAKALQSRAMLFAASIARFGSVQLEGIVGIPGEKENTYWQKSYDASKVLIEQSPHRLYEKYPNDPVKNHHQLFVDEIENNPEVIFTERYDAGSDMGHNHSRLAVHADFATAWNSNFRPYLNMAEKFEFIDGSSGAIPRAEYAAKEWDMGELFDNRDPRFKAAILYNGADFWGSKAYFHEKSFVNGKEVKSGVLPDGTIAKASARAYEPRPKPLRQGFLLRKFLDESPGHQLGTKESSEDFHIFRLGEIYLNMAEAAFYLGHTQEALNLLNRIRQRAGMPDKSVIDEETIRNERAVELAFEEHRFWDIRRWRIAEKVLNNQMMAGLKFEYNYDTGKFKIEVKNADSNPRVFLPQHYYFPLTFDKLSDNAKLIENPYY